MAVNRERLALWIEDLRTTTAKQGRSQLSSENGDCCLGRLCYVALAHGLKQHVKGWGGRAYLPTPFRDWLSVGQTNPCTIFEGDIAFCGELNDIKRLTFPQIADILEAQPEGWDGSEQFCRNYLATHKETVQP